MPEMAEYERSEPTALENDRITNSIGFKTHSPMMA